jgi:outer membrane lipoprotein carrier protein
VKKTVAGMVLAVSLYAEGITLPEHFLADFTQLITNPKQKVIRYSGKIRFSNPSLLKWAYFKPSRKEVCTNGEELRVVDHELEQVSVYFITKGFNLSEIIKQAKFYQKNIYVAHYQGKSYTIQIDGKGRLQSVAYYDELDNKVQIVFKNMKYGRGALPYQGMLCPAPKNYDEIGG